MMRSLGTLEDLIERERVKETALLNLFNITPGQDDGEFIRAINVLLASKKILERNLAKIAALETGRSPGGTDVTRRFATEIRRQFDGLS
jgi:hypothetical protein